MRQPPNSAESYRLRRGTYGSDASYGNNGAFLVAGPCGRDLKVIASDEGDWEHVSVSVERRPPNWSEMCLVKNIFWQDDEAVVQYHPPQSQYVNCHPYCLHMWRPKRVDLPIPPSILVGPLDASNPTPAEAKAMKAWRQTMDWRSSK